MRGGCFSWMHTSTDEDNLLLKAQWACFCLSLREELIRDVGLDGLAWTRRIRHRNEVYGSLLYAHGEGFDVAVDRRMQLRGLQCLDVRHVLWVGVGERKCEPYLLGITALRVREVEVYFIFVSHLHNKYVNILISTHMFIIPISDTFLHFVSSYL
jgi:hypothetical protein